MDVLLRVGLSNAVAACVLAVIAAGVGYVCRRPAVRHALWLLVLLKLVTPPLVDLPVWRAAEPVPASETASAPADDEPDLFTLETAPAPQPEEGSPTPIVEVAASEPVAEPGPDGTEELAEPPAVEQRADPVRTPALDWQPVTLAIWMGGSVLWLTLAAVRVGRFARLLRFTRLAPVSLQREADGLARRLGLARAPVVRLLPGRISPMLWAPGWRAQLLLPAGLLDRLDADARRTLLLHELAHLRRRDHRVRLVELLVTALFWWHPVVWWARRELREAEEQCCDAWVLWALPQSARTYALALVETVDFLCETRPALPALASGMGHVRDLRRRVTMIMQGTTPRALTWSGLLALLGVGVFLLPVRPMWAQEEAAQPPRPVAVPAAEDAQTTQADLDRLLADLKRKEAELQQLQAQVRDAQKRAAQAAATPARGKAGTIVLELVDGNSRQVIKLPAGSRVLSAEQVTRKAEEQGPQKPREVARDPLNIRFRTAEVEKAPVRGLVIEVVSDGQRQVIELPPGSRILSAGETPQPPPAVKRPGQPAAPERAWSVVPVTPGTLNGFIYRAEVKAPDLEKRVGDLEKKLDELIRTVKELQKAHSGPALRIVPAAPAQGQQIQGGNLTPLLVVPAERRP